MSGTIVDQNGVANFLFLNWGKRSALLVRQVLETGNESSVVK